MKLPWLLIAIIAISGCNIAREVCVNERCFKVEIADTSQKQEIGLMNHTTLASDAGMWFVFNKDEKQSFWMKNMKFPIDMIWVDNSYNVVYVVRNAQPCIDSCNIYTPDKNARYVLEVNANSEINIGDKVTVR